MFGISPGELVLIVGIAVIVLGPERCIDLFKKSGRLWRTLRAEIAEVKDALSIEEKKKPPL